MSNFSSIPLHFQVTAHSYMFALSSSFRRHLAAIRTTESDISADISRVIKFSTTDSDRLWGTTTWRRQFGNVTQQRHPVVQVGNRCWKWDGIRCFDLYKKNQIVYLTPQVQLFKSYILFELFLNQNSKEIGYLIYRNIGLISVYVARFFFPSTRLWFFLHGEKKQATRFT